MELQTLSNIAGIALEWLLSNWELIISLPIVSAALLIPKKYIKKYFKHAEVAMIILVTFSGQIASAISYLTSVPTDNPTVVALQGLAYSFGLVLSWFLTIKPVKAWTAKKLIEAKLLNQNLSEAKSAIVPPEGLPIPGNPTVLDDFSR